MKLKDITGFEQFFTTLFDFLHARGIVSSLAPVNDLDGLLRSLLDAELTGWNYTQRYCTIDIDYSGKEKKDTVYMFCLADRDGGSKGPFMLIDIGRKGGLSFISLSFDTEKSLPLARGLVADAGEYARHMTSEEIADIREGSVITMDEFRVFLVNFPRQGTITWVELK